MSTSLVMFMMIDQVASYKYLDSASEFYAGLPTSQCQGETIIGGYQNFGKGYFLERSISLPQHIKIKITAKIFLEDSWDLETLNLYIDGVLIKQYSKNHSDGTHLCGNDIYPEIWYDFSWESDHTNSAITIKFTHNLDEEAWNESFAFKDFKVQVLSECFQLYSECNYKGTEYKFCPKTPLESSEQFLQPIRSIRIPGGRALHLQDPNFNGGVLQNYLVDQACLDPFIFPKRIVVP